jgi:hypothetical protein
MKPNDITVVMTWYGQQDLLLQQVRFYADMAEKYHHRPKVIIMNDSNGPERTYFHECINAYKGAFDIQGVDVVSNDIGFNSHTCRNLGVKIAKTDWVWLMDVDCFEQEDIYHYMRFEKELDDGMFYVPKADMDYPEDMTSYELLDPKGLIKYVTHPNSWIMTKECFWSTGGYDIEFCGVRQGDAEFFISIGRAGHKEWDYDLASEDKMIRVCFPKRDPFYIRQDGWKQDDARELIDFVRTRNQNPYRRYRKRIHDLTWEYV